jgi:hypothetical protein
MCTRSKHVTVLAHIEPGGIADTHKVHTWLTINGSSASCSQPRGSYGVIELSADETTGAFEMAVAGEASPSGSRSSRSRAREQRTDYD